MACTLPTRKCRECAQRVQIKAVHGYTPILLKDKSHPTGVNVECPDCGWKGVWIRCGCGCKQMWGVHDFLQKHVKGRDMLWWGGGKSKVGEGEGK